MLLEELREEVLLANREIARRGLAPHTFGNVSGIDRSGTEPLVVIKPSGVSYQTMGPDDLVITDLHGTIVEGKLRPSSDLDTHTLLYREFPQIGGVVHTHSEFATAWAQANRPIPCLGTTHADYFHGPVPVTDPLSEEEVHEAYVRNTGAVIAMVGVGLFVGTRLALLNPVVIDDHLGVLASLRRAWALTKGGFWRLLGFIAIVLVVSTIAGSAAQAVFGVIGGLVAGVDGARLAGGIAAAGVSGVVQVYMLVMLVRLYRQAAD